MAKLGFGCMRLPMIGGADGTVDQPQFNRMVDHYMQAGLNYFDTAHVYLGGQSEAALREGLVRRYPRSAFLLADKLSGSQFQRQEDILPFFQKELTNCGVEYFDYYLMHSQSTEVYKKFLSCNAYKIVKTLKAQGKIRHWGISFHDKPEVLDKILREQPEIEFVQIQLNYLDMDNPSIESRRCYEICRSHQKPIFIMEPVKGGGLVNLPPEAQEIFQKLGGSAASYALRYAASFPGVEWVLSGMSTEEQVLDNLSSMTPPAPLTPAEQAAIEQVRDILKAQNTIPCTACRYCVAGCPKGILIPDLFSCYNTKTRYQDWGSDYYYNVHTTGHGTPSDCIGCKKCERICPQHLDITNLLQQVAKSFQNP